MKEATGELNMTVVTLIAVAALGAVFYLVVWPLIQRMLIQQTCNTYGEDWHALRGEVENTGQNAKVYEWRCCPGDATFEDQSCITAKSDNGE